MQPAKSQEAQRMTVRFVLRTHCYNARAVIALIQNRSDRVQSIVYWVWPFAGIVIAVEKSILKVFENPLETFSFLMQDKLPICQKFEC